MTTRVLRLVCLLTGFFLVMGAGTARAQSELFVTNNNNNTVRSDRRRQYRFSADYQRAAHRVEFCDRRGRGPGQ
jgi:hypothetical protein